MTVFAARDLDKNLKSSLAAHTGRPVGLAEAPLVRVQGEDRPAAMPYAILYPITAGAFEGSWDNPEEDADTVFQVTYVADSVTSLRWLVSKGRAYFLERAPAGGFLHPINAGDGYAVVHRSCEQPGGIDKESPKLFTLAERYVLKVQAV